MSKHSLRIANWELKNAPSKNTKINTKSQTPNSREAPNTKLQSGAVSVFWSLKGWDFFGVWILGFGVSHH